MNGSPPAPDPGRRPDRDGSPDGGEVAPGPHGLLGMVVPDLGHVEAAEWDALAGADDPFVEHAFLRALETSGSVGAGSGWSPAHVLVRREHERGPLVGAVPLYVKTDSYGEYIFDWGWAAAARRAGIPYYPKLVSAVPFTPATGRRLLTGDVPAAEALAGPLGQALVGGIAAVSEEVDASSIHVLFLTGPEQEALARTHRFLPRLTYQYHWSNDGYGSFDDYLATLRSRSRKEIRRERRQARDSGLTLATKRGPDLSDAEWRALYVFYRDTTGRKGAIPYLTEGFFDAVRATLPHRVVVAIASRDGVPVATSLAFQKGRSLFGRYWGCREHHPGLHFELCYYRLIEHAIDEGLDRFEAGAQGEHKIKRGLVPSPTYSAHWIRHPALAEAVADALPREAAAHEAEMEWLSGHAPFKRE